MYTNPAKEGPSGLVDHQNLHKSARTILDNVRLGWRQDRLAEKLSLEIFSCFLEPEKHWSSTAMIRIFHLDFAGSNLLPIVEQTS